jgi:hypothetical protein
VKKKEEEKKEEEKKEEEEEKKYSYKAWLTKRQKHRVLRNMSSQYFVDLIVWSYCQGDGVLHMKDLPMVLQELGASDSLEWFQDRLFVEKKRKQEETKRRRRGGMDKEEGEEEKE